MQGLNGLHISLPQMKQLIKEKQSEETARMAADISSRNRVIEDGKLIPAGSDSSPNELGTLLMTVSSIITFL